MLRKQLSLVVLFTALSCSVLFGQSSSSHFLLLTNMTSATLPSVNVLTYALLDGFTTRGDGFGGWFYAITNATPLSSDGLNVFRITNSLGQSGNWIRSDLRNTGTNGPVGPVGGVDVTGTLPNNLSVVGLRGVSLGTTTATAGNILVAENGLWQSLAMTGDATISSNAVLTFASVVSAGTGTKITANAKGLVTTIASAVLASADFANQGTTTTLLHGNASGNPSWSAVSLTADVTGTLGVGNGGSGAATFTKGIVVSPGGTTALTTIAGTTGYFPYYSSSYPTTTSPLYTDGTNVVVGATSTTAIFAVQGTAGLPPTSGTSSTYNIVRLQNQGGSTMGVLDFGQYGSAGSWLQSRSGGDYSVNYPILLNPNGGGVGIGTATPSDAGLAINGYLHVGGDSSPGDNNLAVDGTSTLTGLITATASLTYPSATASRATVWDASSKLISSVTTLAELAFVSGVTSSIQTQFAGKTFVPKYVSGDPNSLGTTGDGDGQMCMDTATGNRWFYYTATTSWLP